MIVITLIVVGGCAESLKIKKQKGEMTRDIGEAYLIEGNYTAALRELLKAEEIYPDDPFLQNYLGLTYHAKELYKDAVAHYRRAIELQPDYAPAYNNLGVTYLAMKDWDAAIGVFKQLSANVLYSTPHYAHLNLGWAYFNKDDYQVAADYYRKVIRHYQDGFPKDLVYVKALRGMGKIYLVEGNVAEAEKVMEEAYSIAPNFLPLGLDLAKIRQTMGKKKEAIDAYRKVIEVAPGSEMAAKAREALSKIASEQ